jgi:hypothetical protein
LCFEVGYVSPRGDGWLWETLHLFFCGVHVVYVTHRRAAAVSCEVARLFTVETGPFRSRAVWFFLRLCDRCTHVHIVALVLLAIVGCPGPGHIHGDLYVIVCWLWGIGRVVGWSLLLLQLPLLLILLGMCSP